MRKEQFLDIQAETLDEVRNVSVAKLAQLSVEERATLKEQIIETGLRKTEIVSGMTIQEAESLIASTLPKNSSVMEKRILIEPDTQTVNFDAADLKDAEAIARQMVPDGYIFSNIRTIKPARGGFLGLGKTHGQYSLTSHRSA